MKLTFIGNKTRLLGHINRVLNHYLDGNEKTFVDLFAGTNSVGLYFKPRYRIISNDLMYFSNAIAKAAIVNNEQPDFSTLAKHGISDPYRYFNFKDLSNYKGGFFTKHYSPVGSQRMYFQPKNAKRIDFVRQSIRTWLKKHWINRATFYCLLTSLIKALPNVSNAASTYGAYLKHWKKISYNNLTLRPIKVVNNHQHNKAYRKDANKLVNKLHGDILYIDTPYNSRQYAPNYHIYETATLYDNPKLHGKTGLRPYKDEKSAFAEKSNATKAMKDLLHNLDFKHVLISYSTDGIIPVKTLQKIVKSEAYGNQHHTYKIPYTEFKSRRDEKRHKLYELLIYFSPRYYHQHHEK